MTLPISLPPELIDALTVLKTDPLHCVESHTQKSAIGSRGEAAMDECLFQCELSHSGFGSRKGSLSKPARL
jgi:hypothetical protein